MPRCTIAIWHADFELPIRLSRLRTRCVFFDYFYSYFKYVEEHHNGLKSLIRLGFFWLVYFSTQVTMLKPPFRFESMMANDGWKSHMVWLSLSLKSSSSSLWQVSQKIGSADNRDSNNNNSNNKDSNINNNTNNSWNRLFHIWTREKMATPHLLGCATTFSRYDKKENDICSKVEKIFIRTKDDWFIRRFWAPAQLVIIRLGLLKLRQQLLQQLFGEGLISSLPT